MDFSKATKKQLLQIVLNESCPVIFKFEAKNEYKRRDTRGFNKAIYQAKMVRHME